MISQDKDEEREKQGGAANETKVWAAFGGQSKTTFFTG